MGGRAVLHAALCAVTLLAAASPAASQLLPPENPPAPAEAGARSLVVPGWGQWTLGQGRAMAYAAAEIVLWALWAERRSQGSQLRGEYRDLAWRSARLPAGERLDGTWAYYEALSKWTRSGAWDRDPATPGVQPEEDPLTFNGSVWALARAMHFGGRAASPLDPAWETALSWYTKRAYADGFLWDWTGKEGELTRFRRLVRGSDERFREATLALGATVANHLLSAADAFVSARVPGSAALRISPPVGPTGHPAGVMFSWRPAG